MPLRCLALSVRVALLVRRTDLLDALRVVFPPSLRPVAGFLGSAVTLLSLTDTIPGSPPTISPAHRLRNPGSAYPDRLGPKPPIESV